MAKKAASKSASSKTSTKKADAKESKVVEKPSPSMLVILGQAEDESLYIRQIVRSADVPLLAFGVIARLNKENSRLVGAGIVVDGSVPFGSVRLLREGEKSDTIFVKSINTAPVNITTEKGVDIVGAVARMLCNDIDNKNIAERAAAEDASKDAKPSGKGGKKKTEPVVDEDDQDVEYDEEELDEANIDDEDLDDEDLDDEDLDDEDLDDESDDDEDLDDEDLDDEDLDDEDLDDEDLDDEDLDDESDDDDASDDEDEGEEISDEEAERIIKKVRKTKDIKVVLATAAEFGIELPKKVTLAAAKKAVITYLESGDEDDGE